MRKAQFRRVKQQTLRRGRRVYRVQTVTNNRVTQTRHVNAQLVAAACHGRQADACLLQRFVSCKHDVMCRRRLADRVINHLPWAIRPVTNQWQINRALIIFDHTHDDGNVVFFNEALLECAVECALCVEGSCEHHEPGSFHVEPMHD